MRRTADESRLQLVPDEPMSRIERARLGDRDAISELYAELSPVVIGYMRGGGARDAEDLAGDVFLSMIRTIAAFDGDEAAFRRWIFTIAHHRLVDMRRRETVRSVETRFLSRDDDALDDPYDHVLEQIDAAPAVRALAQLTPEQRDVVLLRSIACLSIADTAAILERTPGSTKSIHRRALAALARLVDREVVS
jgi:RNA polymerase sigma factor (sigma-70 family)